MGVATYGLRNQFIVLYSEERKQGIGIWCDVVDALHYSKHW